MTLPASGPISFSQINTELGRSGNAAISLGDSLVRTLAGKSSGAISMNDLRGKSNSGWTLSISPSSRATSTKNFSSQFAFTVSVSSGTPTSYNWGVLSADGGNGVIVTGGATATATLQVQTTNGATGYIVFYCDVTIGGVTKRATVSYSHTYIDTGGGGTA